VIVPKAIRAAIGVGKYDNLVAAAYDVIRLKSEN
jgi:hypothetical protein